MREPLSRERVLSTAVALADKEGTGALTMRRLAAELGVEAMSLYYHLPGKDGLLDGLVETVLAEVIAAVDETETATARPKAPGRRRAGTRTAANREAADRTATDRTAAGPGDWRATLRRWFLAARTVMLRHPWAPELIGTRRRIPDGLYAYYERILGTLIEAGFSYRIAHRALHAFGSMPLGFVQELFAPAPGEGDVSEPDEAELAAMAQALPHMTAMMAAEMHAATDPTLGWCDSQTEFEFTLDLLLDGLERFRNT